MKIIGVLLLGENDPMNDFIVTPKNLVYLNILMFMKLLRILQQYGAMFF
jgi:hypothetical protein